MPIRVSNPCFDRFPRVCSRRGVTWDSHINAWVASMKRRTLVLREVFEVAQYGDEIALALAIVRRTRMEIFWRNSKLKAAPSPPATVACNQTPTKRVTEKDVVCSRVPDERPDQEEGLFFDSCSQSWIVRWSKKGQIKRKHFRISAPDSFIKAFEFNDRIRRKAVS